MVFVGQKSHNQITRLKSRSNFEIAITRSIFELERRTKSQNVESGMAYLGVGLKFRYNFGFKNSPRPQYGGHFEDFEIFQIGSFWHLIWKDRPKLTQKILLMLMTFPMTSQRDVKMCLLYSCLNEIVTFSAIQVAVFHQSSPNLVHIFSLPQYRTL